VPLLSQRATGRRSVRQRREGGFNMNNILRRFDSSGSGDGDDNINNSSIPAVPAAPTAPVPVRPSAVKPAAVMGWVETATTAPPPQPPVLLCPKPVVAVRPINLSSFGAPLSGIGGGRFGVGSCVMGSQGVVASGMGGAGQGRNTPPPHLMLRNTPPPHLLATDVTAAALLLGSPVGGMAAADTLLQMLLMGAGGDAGDDTGAEIKREGDDDDAEKGAQHAGVVTK
jgi:hypothetical protein